MMLRRYKENPPVEIPVELLIEEEVNDEPQIGANPETLIIEESVEPLEIPAEDDVEPIKTGRRRSGK